MFDRLVESTAERRNRRTWLFFAASSVVWTLVLCAVAVAGVFAYDARLDADFSRIGLIVAQMPPPPPPPLGGHTQPAARNAAPVQQTGLVARTVAPDVVAPPAPHPPAVGPAAPLALGEGSPYGSSDGVVGGDPTSQVGIAGVPPVAHTPAPPPPDPPDPAPVVRQNPVPPRPVSVGVISGKAIRRVQPPYPTMAKATNVTGDVVVEVNVDENGKVTSARVLSGHPLLRDAAYNAARAWTFSPTFLSGKPVRVIGTITFSFKM